MYNALIRSHPDYCDIIYHIPSVKTQFAVTITDLMEKLKEYNTNQLLLLPACGKVQVVLKSMRNGLWCNG